jgi:hypothetical protein
MKETAEVLMERLDNIKIAFSPYELCERTVGNC